jgi:hypothetical protein
VNPEAVRVLNVLREIEVLAEKLRVQLAKDGPGEFAARCDDALARLRAAAPRVEALTGSGAA